MTPRVTMFWFRRDLRLDDNKPLYFALKDNDNVLPVFIFDTDILSAVANKDNRQVAFIHAAVAGLNAELQEHGGSLLVLHGKPSEVWRKLIQRYHIGAVYAGSAAHEPYAERRDREVRKLLEQNGIAWHAVDDHRIFNGRDIVKDDGRPYTVYTPYMKRWRKNFHSGLVEPFDSQRFLSRLYKTAPSPVPALETLGFTSPAATFPENVIRPSLLKNYAHDRDFPAQVSTSRLGIHLRFGTLSIRRACRIGMRHSDVWINQLIWREFYMMLLEHFPGLLTDNFDRRYDAMPWREDREAFERWCRGLTGFPIIDAGMRELNETGFMHNRVRMLTASFLSRLLLIDWRQGERYFAARLLDYEAASNVGNWQWAAGTGTDAQPYFRIFNPTLQTKRFDPDLKYVKKWVSELDTSDYPQPIIDYAGARVRSIEICKNLLRAPRSAAD